MNETLQIAIDGPVAAGKGTVSRLLAERLAILYVDTGATYRVATLIAAKHQLPFELLDGEDPATVAQLVSLLEKSQIELRRPSEAETDGRLITVLLDGEDVSLAIRDETVSAKVYVVAKLPAVREVLVEKQQAIAASQPVVMEGRDITYRVLPHATLKIFLDAAPDIRLSRRIAQLKATGKPVDEKLVAKELTQRDLTDSTRATDPLKLTEGVWHLDGSYLTPAQTVEVIVERLHTMGALDAQT